MHVSFIIPAHNEAAHLPATIAALRESIEGAALVGSEIIVVDDASTDDTAPVAREAGATNVVTVDRRQISAARNAGAAAATGDLYIFIDADTLVTADAVREAAAAIARGRGFGGARVRFDEPSPSWARALLIPMMMGYRVARLAPGCFFVVTREWFEEVGGFDETVYAAEEALLARALRKAGAKHYLGKARVTTSGRKLRDHSAWTIAKLSFRLATRGVRGVKSRDGLEMWYGESGERVP